MKKNFCRMFILVLVVLFAGVHFAGDEKQVFAEEQAEAEELSDLSLGEMLNLENYLMTATKHLMDARKAPAISTVITADEIRNMGARNLNDILKTVPGLGIAKGNGVGHQTIVRGIKTPYSEKVLLMIDGHRVNNSYTGDVVYVFDSLITENIKRVEIIRGPGSALYGTSAFVAVINVITKTAEDIGGQQISVSGGSFSTQKYNMLFSKVGAGYQISGHIDYFDTDGEDAFIEKDFWYGKPAALTPGEVYRFEEKMDAEVRIEYGDFSLRGRIADNKASPYLGPGMVLTRETVISSTQFLGDIAYAKDLTENLDLSMRLYGDYNKYDYNYKMRPTGYTGGNDVGLLGRPMIKMRAFGGEITSNYVFGDHLITNGFCYEKFKTYDIDSANNFKDVFANPVKTPEDEMYTVAAERNTWAVYLQDMWEITAYDSLIIGIRYDEYDDFGGTANPRIGYVHEFGFGLVTKLLYGSAFRAPMFSELYDANNDFLVGNPKLNPEEIRTYEFGMEYSFLKHFTARLNYFHNDIENLITMEPMQPEGPREYVNSDGTTRVNGVEAELDIYFAKDRYGYINCSYQDGEDSNGKTLADVPHWMANAGFNYGLFKYLNANLNISWTGKRPRPEGDIREDPDSNTLVNLTLIAKNFYKGLEIRGSVYNLFDEDYRDPCPNTRVPNDFPTNLQTVMLEARYTF